jgi:hypothetical protein
VGSVIILVGIIPKRPHGVRNHYVLRHSCLSWGGIDVRELQTKHQPRIVVVVIEDAQVGRNTLEPSIMPPVGERRPARRNGAGEVGDVPVR